ncbi:hypothetical protein N7456_010870 [Penicillium angulare]|uniref:Uncharacterized protein n=1 Tax=Penicillium angulare TaxID=116970 RepID=A0A9W9JZ62_9EURO|nr:hypothetical protein N7456_010870 [Penicillium angulare]
MAFPNSLDAGIWETREEEKEEKKKKGEITMEWHENAKVALPENARRCRTDEAQLKAATEHFADATAKRLGKAHVKILRSFHDDTTDVATKVTRPDKMHSTIGVGNMTVHTYVDLGGAIKVEKMQVVGESVFKHHKKTPDPDLSFGAYTQPQ